ncbi:MAG: NnrU family protein [Alphaproteobacteria bacterium]|nr:NnrU family protein [Alphaproteobacteria bacterium]
MSGWGKFTVAFLAFYGSHMIPARPAVRRRLAAAFGERGYLVIYSLLSIALLVWLIAAAANAPHVALWERALWQNIVPQIVMLPACLLAAFGIGAEGGLSLGSRKTSPFDPALPGIAGITRHPLLWALALWSLSHLAPNGDLAHVILFGSFAASALFGMSAFDQRSRRNMGDADWREVRASTAFVPFARGLECRGTDRPWLRGFIGVGLYLTLLLLHEPLMGLSPT